ncbi:MAG: phage holin family protein [Candidatus Woykebacteria bacterium]
MKKLAKQFILSFSSFLVVAYFYPGFSFEKSQVVLLSAFAFALLGLFMNPILKALSLPLNLFTFGLFSFSSGAVLIFLVKTLVAGFTVKGFDFVGADLLGFVVPGFYVIPFLSALAASALIGWLSTILRWVFH